MKSEDDPAPPDSSVYVQFTQPEDAQSSRATRTLKSSSQAPPNAADGPVPTECKKFQYSNRRVDLLIRTTLPAPRNPPLPRPCAGCGQDPCQQAGGVECVADLPPAVQNLLRYQMGLICGVFLAVVAVTGMLLEGPLGIGGHEENVISVSFVVVCVFVCTITTDDLKVTSRSSWLQFIVLGVAQGGIITGIDNSVDSRSLLVMCCAMSFIFLVVAAYIKRASSYQSSFTLEDAPPVSPVKASFAAYLLAAIVQIAAYAGSVDSTLVTRSGLVGCLITELVLVLFLLWELSQMTRSMTQEEVPRVLGYLYLDLLLLMFYAAMVVSVITAAVCFCVVYCVFACITCRGFELKDDGHSGSVSGTDGVPVATGAARIETARPESLKQKLGDAFQKKMRGALL